MKFETRRHVRAEMKMMNTKTIAVLWGTCALAAARPGDLDRAFDPELRAWVAPDEVAVAHDGQAWIGGGFDQGDGYSAGDLIRLGENGGVENEPAQGYIRRTPSVVSIDGIGRIQAVGKPFQFANGDFLLPGESGGWLRMNATGGVLGKAFPDRLDGETIIPQFERDGKLWVIRSFADGGRLLERRSASGGSLESAFPQPANVRAAAPAPDGGVWMLAGDDSPWYDFWNGTAPEQQILNLDGDGNSIGATKVFSGNRDMRLIAGTDGSFRIEFGPDRSMWMYWPASSYGAHTIEWFSADGIFERRKHFNVAPAHPFPWAESTDGALMVAAGNGTLQLFAAGETVGSMLPAHRNVRSIHTLPDGKWLIDGLYRLNADGNDDESWSVPELSTPAQVEELHPMANGRMLAAGNFATADGIVRNRLVVFQKNGTIYPSFIPDDRIGEWRSVAATKEAIYVVTEEPVSYGDGIRSNLVKLRPDGTLDEGYYPLVPLTTWTSGVSKQTVDHVTRVIALAGGDILAETSSTGGDVMIRIVVRLKNNGARNPDFRSVNGGLGSTVLARASGGFASDGLIYQANGSIERDLSKPGSRLRPLCEHSGGVIFAEAIDGGAHRLRLWTRRGWAAWFKAPALDNAYSTLATPGEFGLLYVSATLKGGSPAVFRLLPNGRLDRSFRSPVFGKRERQFAGGWWTAEESGKVAFDPAIHEFTMPPGTILWQPATRRLWASGSFNMVDGKPRDGLARLTGGFWPWRWW